MRINTNDILFGAIYTAPLMFFSVGSASLYKVFAMLLLFMYLYELMLKRKFSISSPNKYWKIQKHYFYYCIIIQIIFGSAGQFLYGDYNSDFSSIPLVRLGTQLFTFSYLIVTSIYIYRATIVDPSIVIRPFSLSIKTLLIISLYEVVSIIFPSLPQIPMYIINSKDSLVHSNLSSVLSAIRVHSLAGEPRFYVAILIVVLNTSLFCFYDTIDSLSVKDKSKWILSFLYLFFLIVYTQSTSGLLLLAIMVPWTFFIAKSIKFRKKIKMIFYILLVILLLSPILFDVIQNRLISRISEEILAAKDTRITAFINIPIFGRISLDATDVTPTALIIDKPWLLITGVGFGNTSTYVKPYLPDYGGYWGYNYTGIVESNIAFIKNILSYGIIGNSMLIILYMIFYKHYKIYYSNYSRMELASFYCMVSVFITIYTLTSPMLIPIWFFSFHAALLWRRRKYFEQL